jgi:hypothetical protein
MKNKIFYLLLSLTGVLAAGCYDDISDLHPNLLDIDSDIELFTITLAEHRGDHIHMEFTHALSSLSYTQQQQITHIIEYRNGVKRATLLLDRTFIKDYHINSNSTYCFQFGFFGYDFQTRLSQEICVNT